ncbi:methylenetetrahydromethanopterin dehydrogenase [Aminithiophilus ramosus]|uniref:Methylenetetrahydromethanopterin dehydrogenase n=2 Tax=Synergistales TaxID=649776 RepID=A0A9Q7AMM5_9BACT|nr:NAD(P)-dependent methylenetetrahydromethanopterin dehydrogenase [Aminithiophilus ramosus]QTX31712.1 methylenetetrahydromethanopterin dehydrogenase [Aminithiophilus ramosus]QVL35535.1 methylenetetrahydromethanopterin dehydrogenase [Synergistota bacterium]
MKKILLQLDSDGQPSVFDAVAALDGGAEVLLRHGGVTVEAVSGLVHGVIFTRGPEDLHGSAIFIGGSDVARGEALLEATRKAFFGPLQVSVLFDANGCNTTAAAAVAKMAASLGGLEGKRVTVLGGTGPVGLRGAALLALDGAQVRLTSRRADRATEAVARLKARFGVDVEAAVVSDDDERDRALGGTQAVLAAGAAGVTLLRQSLWQSLPELRVLADVNAVPPLGIEGVKSHWDGRDVEGKILFGALAIGGLKMKIHKAAVARLFESNDAVLDAEELFALAKERLGL